MSTTAETLPFPSCPPANRAQLPTEAAAKEWRATERKALLHALALALYMSTELKGPAAMLRPPAKSPRSPTVVAGASTGVEAALAPGAGEGAEEVGAL